MKMKPPESASSVATASTKQVCYHCGAPLRWSTLADNEKRFCCRGCLSVYQLLVENGLTDFYKFSDKTGAKVETVLSKDQYRFLNEPMVSKRLVSFADNRITRVKFRVPAMHCVACVWLLENLFRLHVGIGRSEVNFLRKELYVTFEHEFVTLADIAALLASLGYPPELNFSDLEGKPLPSVSRRLWMQIAVAGFAFGNTMLFSIPAYLGLDKASHLQLASLFGWLSLLLAVPVLVYSAADYWRASWAGLRQHRLTIEVPLIVGIVALFVQSAILTINGHGEGYFDSFCGLVFFLLCGKAFQQKTYDRLVFDRDYKSFLPLSVIRIEDGVEERVSLAQIRVGDRLILRNGELITADARLVSGTGCVDYSFVTGESRPVHKVTGDYLYCGGRQKGGSIEVETLKDVSQSHLSSLWNQDVFRKEKGRTFDSLTNQYSERFSRLVLAVAVGAAVFWAFWDPQRSLRTFTAVLIVACPCALALCAPFALGTAQRILARRGVFLRNAQVIETLARIDTVVFDKTGTLTTIDAVLPVFHGAMLTGEESRWVASLCHQSTHPYSAQIVKNIAESESEVPGEVRSFVEMPGCGMTGCIDGHDLSMGSAAWLASRGASLPVRAAVADGSEVHLAIDAKYRGHFSLPSELRPEIESLAKRLSNKYEIALISGDNDRDQPRMRQLFGQSAPLRFNQSPLDKLEFIRECQQRGNIVMMAGDGLNDAGALQQSDVGVAVVENINGFSPASDVIMAAEAVPRLDEVLRFAKSATRVVQVSFLISSIYNAAGLTIAARGLLSPIVCAVLMPLSSVTVVIFACGVTSWLGRRFGIRPVTKPSPRIPNSKVASLPVITWQPAAEEESLL